jgi:tetratricopeptide (TPR) repeat protein
MSTSTQQQTHQIHIARLATVPLDAIVALLAAIVSPRGLALAVVGLLVLFGANNWLRHPLSADRDAFTMSVFADGPEDAEMPEVDPFRRPILSSPGAILLIGAAIAAGLIVWRPASTATALSLLLCVAVGLQLAVVLNHPQVIDSLDHERHLTKFLISLLTDTVTPDLDVGVRSRGGFSGAYVGRSSFLEDAVYIPVPRLAILGLAAIAVLCSGRGPLRRRLARLVLWGLAGVALGGLLAGRRLIAESHWLRAVDAESRGDLGLAIDEANAAVRAFPPLEGVQRTWLLVGKIDYQRRQLTPASRYYLATQKALNGDTRRGVEELQGLALAQQPVPQSMRWLASAISEMAYELYEAGDVAAAESAWQRSLQISEGVPFDELCLAVLAARRERRDPEATATLLSPLLPRIGDRSVKAAMLSLLGDCYFQNSQMLAARQAYAESLAIYTLPKQINYRAIRGLLGM